MGIRASFIFSAVGGKVYFIPTFGAVQNCSMEEEGGGSGTFLQGEPGTGAVPKTFLVVTSPGTAALNPTAQLVPKNFIYWTM